MKSFIVKLTILFVFLFSYYLIEGLIIKKTFTPYYEHITFIKSPDKELINTEQGGSHRNDSIFVERNAARLHTTLHNTSNEIFDCEESNDTNCYVSAISCLINQSSEILKSFLIKGREPQNNSEIVLNLNLAKRLSLTIGDQLCLKTPLSNTIVTVCGLIKNPYGLTDFNNDAFYYVFTLSDENYLSKVNGTYYTFSNETGSSFISEPIAQQKKSFLQIEIIYATIVFILSFFIDMLVLMGFSRIFTIKQYYKKLYSLGKQKESSFKLLKVDLIFYLCFCIFLSAIFSSIFLFFILNAISVISVIIIYYVNIRIKIYGINRI